METVKQLEQELSALDEAWVVRRESLMDVGKDGKRSEPTGKSLIPRVLVMVGSVIVMAFLSASSLPTVFVYLFLVPFAVATFQLISGAGKSDSFDREQAIYESQRSSLIRRIEKSKREAPVSDSGAAKQS
jgi:hypothetical protein